MSQYKDVENIRKLFDNEYKSTRKLIDEGETHLDNLAEGFSEATSVLDMLPNADVVPKSEVEQLQHKYDLAVAEREANVKGFTDEIAKVKTEVVREIIKALEELLQPYKTEFKRGNVTIENLHCCPTYKGYSIPKYEVDAFITELKKKYGGDCTTCKHLVSCEPNPFGICDEYKEGEK